MTPEQVELFVGQMIALLPRLTADDADAGQLHQLRRLFPAVDSDRPPVGKVGSKALRPRVYSLITNGKDGGVLDAGGEEIPVSILPLDIGTPPEATAFRVAAISGRALRIRGIAPGDQLT